MKLKDEQDMSVIIDILMDAALSSRPATLGYTEIREIVCNSAEDLLDFLTDEQLIDEEMCE